MKAIKKIKLNEFRVMNDSEMKGVTGGMGIETDTCNDPLGGFADFACFGSCKITTAYSTSVNGTCKGFGPGTCTCEPDKDIFNPPYGPQPYTGY